MKKYDYNEICVQMSKVCTQIDKLTSKDLYSINDLKEQSIKVLKSKLQELDIVLESESELYFIDLLKENSNFFRKNLKVFRKTFDAKSIPFYANPNFIIPYTIGAFDNVMIIDKKIFVFNKDIDLNFHLEMKNMESIPEPYKQNFDCKFIDVFSKLKNGGGFVVKEEKGFYCDWENFKFFPSTVKTLIDFKHFLRFLKKEEITYKEKLNNLYFIDKLETNEYFNKLNSLLKKGNVKEKNLLKYVEYENKFLEKCKMYNFYNNFVENYTENTKLIIGDNIEINSIIENIFKIGNLLLYVFELLIKCNVINEKSSKLGANDFTKTFLKSSIEDEKTFKILRDFVSKFGFVLTTDKLYDYENEKI